MLGRLRYVLPENYLANIPTASLALRLGRNHQSLAEWLRVEKRVPATDLALLRLALGHALVQIDAMHLRFLLLWVTFTYKADLALIPYAVANDI